MRIHQLDITGLGPYAGSEKIEFDGLNDAGVLLLSGPTGSGKTTILDAVCFALFGEIPRAAKGGELVSHHRKIETTPEVIIEFTVAGSLFRVTRRPEYERPKKRDHEELTVETQFVCLERFSNETWTDESAGWKGTNKQLRRLIGMNADQFHQLVLLPQGKFARFLEAGAADRKELLETLFPGNDLTYVEDWLKKRAQKDAESRNGKLQQISDRLEQARTDFDTLTTDLEKEEAEPPPEFPPHHEAVPVNEWTDAVRKRLEGRAAEAEKTGAASQKVSTEAQAALAAAANKKKLISQRGEAEDRVSELEAKSEWRDRLAARNDSAGRAAVAVPLIQEYRTRLAKAEETDRNAQQLAKALRSDESVGTDEEPALKTMATEFGKGVTTIENFERDGLQRRRELDRLVNARAAELKRLETGGPGSDLAEAEDALAEAKKAREKARLELVEIRRRRTAGMAAELAESLAEGEPCPVCGSVEHPGADHSEAPPVSEAEEEQAAKRDEQTEGTLSKATQSRDAAEAESREKMAKLKQGLGQLQSELEKLVKTESGLAAGEASPTARRERLESLVEKIGHYLETVRTTADAHKAADESRVAAESGASKSGFSNLAEAEAASVAPEELAESRAEVDSHDEALNMARGLLGGELREIDRNEQVDLTPLEKASAETAERRDRDTGVLATATERLETFTGVTADIPTLFEELTPLREAASCSAELNRLASGDNDRRMKLSIYVLAVRLKQVIQAANRHLQRMSNGRYELVYSGDVAAHGATSGLGIRVFDSHTSETRSTGTFSGGESFYASLSLALGLAEVVQQETGGKPLETLFIDEGFGTLDSKTLDQVMDVIDDLREGGRTVGLVSHVDELRNRVTARIEVKAGRTGSTLEVVGV